MPVDPRRLLRVFLCHSSQDKPVVRELYQRLREDGVEPWFDEEDLIPGQDWHLEITKAIRTSDVVVVCLSSKTINKAGYVQREVKYALDKADEQPEGTIFLIPLCLDECEVPERLRRWQWIKFADSRWYERLMGALQKRAADLEPSVEELKETGHSRLGDVTQMIEKLLSKVIAGKQLRFESAIAPDLAVAVPFEVVYLTLMTLVADAIEASPSGSIIRIEAQGDGANIFCHVIDHGRGVLADQHERLFGIGFSAKPGGTGAGLALARRAMRRHGGEVFLSDSGTEGTHMTVLFPSHMLSQ